MESDLRSIGETARSCGLTVSALRFYDEAGVLAPAWVDPRSGYRFYGADQVRAARLIARLRRVGLPLGEIRLVLSRSSEPDLVDRVLSQHLRRLEDGLADARRELSAVRTFLAPSETPMSSVPTTVTVDQQELLTALRSVRFAAATDPAAPALCGVLLDVEGPLLRLVATDRYRLAVAAAPAAVDGPDTSVVAPLDLVDELARTLADRPGQVRLQLDGDRIEVAAPGGSCARRRLDHDFPNYRSLIRLEGHDPLLVNAGELRAQLTAAPYTVRRRDQDDVAYEVSTLSVLGDGRLAAGSDPAARELVAVNRTFLLEALDAAGAGQLVLTLDGPIGPLAIRNPLRPDAVNLLMPVRTD